MTADSKNRLGAYKNKREKYIVVPFLIIIFGFFMLNIIMPDKTVSVSENRTLEKKPTIQDIKNGTFASKFDKYYSDHFVFRDKILRTDRMFEALLGKSEVGNYYLTKDNWILGKFPKILTNSKLEEYAGAINELANISHDAGKDVYFTLTPHKTNMLKHLYPKFVDNKESIDINKQSFASHLNQNNITVLDLDEDMENKFSSKERERLYFKTDHHWNGTGAFEGFKLMADKMELGLTDKQLTAHFNKYKTVKCEEKNFIGRYNSNINMIVNEKEYPEFVYMENQPYEYFHSDGKTETKIKEEDIFAISRDKKEWSYGGAYIDGDKCNILKIRNKNALTDKKILVFRDSYEAPTTLMFADLFSEVEIVDPRNIQNIDMSYKEMIENSDADIVMFMYNSSGFDDMIDAMIDKGIK